MTNGTAEAPLLTVRGEAGIETDPEVARVGVSVGAEGLDRRQVLDDLTRANTLALDLIASYGDAVERVSTGGLSVAPAFVLDDRGQVMGYQGRVHIGVRVTDFTALGELVTRLAELDLISVEGPSWELRHDSPVPGEVRRAAVREAVRRAREYADALGTTLAALLELSDEGGRAARPRAEAAFAQRTRSVSLGQPAPLDLELPQLWVEAAVVARFTLRPPSLDA
ncbi:SIMPL domain-containing protein [Streptomyces acidiscabies]|uniref:26 kDa periplasmic immunogenic protein n=1 Tax=Streptomyces acidiscabies TaxID=42234 RepID=A0A0L0KL91_9ACTN|nr:SIMPL domain-containing protein [Streptomyces acidiscabies]KND38581.1 hypothetical protein IQ63_07080 [Streptomyces acidiscabies]